MLLSLSVLLVANLLPLLGVALWGWKLFDLIVIYWLAAMTFDRALRRDILAIR